jgi:hypothetical protein
MDAQTLAQTLTSFLAPCLPYLLKVGEEAAKEAGKQLGESVWETAQALWAKLRPQVETKPAAQEAAQDVALAPDDPDALTVLRVQLKKLLVQDLSLAQEMFNLTQGDVVQRVVAKGTVSDVEQEARGQGKVRQEAISQKGDVRGVKQRRL